MSGRAVGEGQQPLHRVDLLSLDFAADSLAKSSKMG